MSKWEKVRLGEIGEGIIGLTYKPEDVSDEGVIVLRSGNIQDNKLDLNDIVRVKKNISEKIFVKDSDILICSRNGSSKLVGKAAIINGLNVAMTFGAFMMVFRSKFNNYLIHFFHSVYFRRQLATSATSTINQITKKMLDDIIIPLPPLEVQKQIAATLDAVSELLTMRKQQLVELNELIKSVFYKMFGDLEANDKHWISCSIVEVCDEIVDCVNKTAPVLNEKSPYKMIRTTNIKNGYVDTQNVKYVDKNTFEKWTRRSIPQKGDILLTREAPIGEVGIINSDENLFLGQRIVSYRTVKSKLNPLYLRNLMQSRYFQLQINKLARGSTVKHLSVPECTQFSVLVPPLELQNQFADIVTKIEEQKSLVKQAIDETQQLFDSLMSHYFDD